MKASPLFLILALAAGSHAAQQVYPEPIPDGKYEKMKSDSPFVLAKPPEQPQEAKVTWAENLYLSSVAMHRTGEGGEQPWVTIKDKAEPASFIALTLNQEKDGLQLVKVENLEDPRKTTATVKKNNEFATLKRDEAAFTSAPAPPPVGLRAPGGGARVPGHPAGIPVPNGQGAIRQPAVPPPSNLPKGPAIPRPTIPAPGAAAPGANQPAAAPAGQPDARKRIRVINNGR
jgi:hypothetical protein